MFHSVQRWVLLVVVGSLWVSVEGFMGGQPAITAARVQPREANVVLAASKKGKKGSPEAKGKSSYLVGYE